MDNFVESMIMFKSGGDTNPNHENSYQYTLRIPTDLQTYSCGLTEYGLPVDLLSVWPILGNLVYMCNVAKLSSSLTQKQ